MKSSPGKEKWLETHFLTHNAKVSAPGGEHPDPWLSKSMRWLVLCPVINGFQCSPSEGILEGVCVHL